MGLELYVIMNSLERRHDCILYLVNLKNREGHIFWIRVNIIKKIVWMRYCIIKKKKKKIVWIRSCMIKKKILWIRSCIIKIFWIRSGILKKNNYS